MLNIATTIDERNCGRNTLSARMRHVLELAGLGTLVRTNAASFGEARNSPIDVVIGL